MRVWLTFRHERDASPLLVAAEDDQAKAEKFRGQLANFSGERYAILPVEIDDGEVAGLFAEPCDVCGSTEWHQCTGSEAGQ